VFELTQIPALPSWTDNSPLAAYVQTPEICTGIAAAAASRESWRISWMRVMRGCFSPAIEVAVRPIATAMAVRIKRTVHWKQAFNTDRIGCFPTHVKGWRPGF